MTTMLYKRSTDKNIKLKKEEPSWIIFKNRKKIFTFPFAMVSDNKMVEDALPEA